MTDTNWRTVTVTTQDALGEVIGKATGSFDQDYIPHHYVQWVMSQAGAFDDRAANVTVEYTPGKPEGETLFVTEAMGTLRGRGKVEVR